MFVSVILYMSFIRRMESFPEVASRVLQEFKTLLQHGPSLLGCSHMLQIITINMFAIHNAQIRGDAAYIHVIIFIMIIIKQQAFLHTVNTFIIINKYA